MRAEVEKGRRKDDLGSLSLEDYDECIDNNCLEENVDDLLIVD